MGVYCAVFAGSFVPSFDHLFHEQWMFLRCQIFGSKHSLACRFVGGEIFCVETGPRWRTVLSSEDQDPLVRIRRILRARKPTNTLERCSSSIDDRMAIVIMVVVKSNTNSWQIIYRRGNEQKQNQFCSCKSEMLGLENWERCLLLERFQGWYKGEATFSLLVLELTTKRLNYRLRSW